MLTLGLEIPTIIKSSLNKLGPNAGELDKMVTKANKTVGLINSISPDELKSPAVKQQITAAANNQINLAEELAHPAFIFLTKLEAILDKAYATNKENLFAQVASVLIENQNLNQSLTALNKKQLKAIANQFSGILQDIAVNNREFKDDLMVEKTLKQAVDTAKTPRMGRK